MSPRWAADIFDKVAELGAQGNEDLVLVLNRLCATKCQLRGQYSPLQQSVVSIIYHRETGSAPRECAQVRGRGQWWKDDGWRSGGARRRRAEREVREICQ